MVWRDLKQRTTPGTACWNKNKTYQDVSNDFLDYQDFAEFCNTEYGFTLKYKNKFWSLDKDILVPQNKSYNKETCIFVPAYVNNMFLRSINRRGDYPLGVTKQNDGPNPLVVNHKHLGKTLYLGLFNDPFKAHRVWQLAKIKTLRETSSIEEIIPHDKLVAALNNRADMIQKDYDDQIETIL
jgi:hypothetical protein